jgi:metallo-beta-lactamase family protein
VGRTQELLYGFARHWDEWKLSRWRIFLDSPMALRVTEVYSRHGELFDAQAQKVLNGSAHPFQLPNLHMTPDVAQSMRINAIRGGAIIIAGSGMCNGGRIRHHLRQNLGRRSTHVVFVGYQAKGTLGRRLVDGATRVRIFSEDIHVNGHIHTVGGLSAHADQPMLLDWYGGFENRPLVHGEDKAREPFADALRERFGCEVTLSAMGRTVEVGASAP